MTIQKSVSAAEREVFIFLMTLSMEGCPRVPFSLLIPFSSSRQLFSRNGELPVPCSCRGSILLANQLWELIGR